MNGDLTKTGPFIASIAPWLSVANATQAVEFYTTAFSAVEVECLEDEAGTLIVAQLRVGGAPFWVQQDENVNPNTLGSESPVRMILTLDDPDTVVAQAVEAGAIEVAAVHEENGWRIGRVVDASGHHWEIGRPLTP